MVIVFHEFIDWEPTVTGNVHVKNDTVDYYRFFDATARAEFLYQCVENTIKNEIPDEMTYLEAYDRFSQEVQSILDVPHRKIDLINDFLTHGKGKFSKRARAREFKALTDQEVKKIEALYANTFGKLRVEN